MCVCCDFKNGEKYHLMLLLLYFAQTRIPLNAILRLTTHLFDSPLTGTGQCCSEECLVEISFYLNTQVCFCVFGNSGEQKNWLKAIEVSGKTLLKLISKCNFMHTTYGDGICHLHNSPQQ